MDEQLAKDILRNYREQLLIKLPLEREIFLAKLEKANLLPDNTGSSIRACKTRAEKVDYFLQYCVNSSPKLYLPKLIEVMEQYDDLAVKELARDMKEYSGRLLNMLNVMYYLILYVCYLCTYICMYIRRLLIHICICYMYYEGGRTIDNVF